MPPVFNRNVRQHYITVRCPVSRPFLAEANVASHFYVGALGDIGRIGWNKENRVLIFPILFSLAFSVFKCFDSLTESLCHKNHWLGNNALLYSPY
jgi:hypothetical protein